MKLPCGSPHRLSPSEARPKPPHRPVKSHTRLQTLSATTVPSAGCLLSPAAPHAPSATNGSWIGARTHAGGAAATACTSRTTSGDPAEVQRPSTIPAGSPATLSSLCPTSHRVRPSPEGQHPGRGEARRCDRREPSGISFLWSSEAASDPRAGGQDVSPKQGPPPGCHATALGHKQQLQAPPSSRCRGRTLQRTL